jgi:hypothetical protein
MRLSRTIAAIALSVATIFTLPASATSLGASPTLSEGLVTQVRGCHRDVERHYVPEFGRRAWHYHRGSRCRPVRVDGPGSVIGPGPGPGPRDCHRDARRHFLPEYGRSVVHRHVGGSCRVRVLRRSQSFQGGGACVTIGPVTFCD